MLYEFPESSLFSLHPPHLRELVCSRLLSGSFPSKLAVSPPRGSRRALPGMSHGGDHTKAQFMPADLFGRLRGAGCFAEVCLEAVGRLGAICCCFTQVLVPCALGEQALKQN